MSDARKGYQMGRRPSSADDVGGDVGEDLAAAQHIVARLRHKVGRIRETLEFLMALNDDLTTDLDTLTTSVTGIVAAYVANNKVIADLQAQLAAGPPGLTADQGAAIQARFAAVNKQIADALTPSVTVPPATPAA